MKFLAFWYLAFLAAFFVALPPGVAEGGAGLAGRDSGKKTKGKAKKKKGKGPTEVFEPFDKILELNGAALFGGKITLKGERLEIVYDQQGQLPVGFEGAGILDTNSPTLSDSFKDMIKDIPGLVAFGLGRGMWTSRFPLAGEVWVEFGMRVPNLIGAKSYLGVRVNWNDRKRTGYETGFFQTISPVSGGRPRGKQRSPLKKYQVLPHRWFPRGEPTSLRVAFGMREGSLVAQIKSQDVVKLSAKKVRDRGGKVAFVFNELTYTIDNLRIRGKVDRDWCQEQFAELKKAGKLKRPPPPVPPPETEPVGEEPPAEDSPTK